MKELSLNTQLVHTGERGEAPTGTSVSTPIYTTTTYTYPTMSKLSSALAGEDGDFSYSRYGNPTVAALEEVMAAIEKGKGAVAFGSGMAAMHAALMVCGLGPGSLVLASQDLYGASFALLNKVFGQFGITMQMADFNDLEALGSAVADGQPKVLIAETISNPLLKVCDLEAVAEISHSAGAKLIVDNTFASPYLAQPLSLGADIVVHSTTKYLAGHGDSTGGVVVSSSESEIEQLHSIKKLVGGIMSVWEAHHVLRGIKTLALRHERQCENAEAIAKRLAGNDKIARVFFPNSSDDLKTVRKLLRDPFGGALVTIRLRDDSRESAFRFMDALKICVRATSLGDVQTLVSHPATSSHRELTSEQRVRIGVTEGMVRVSVGIEGVEDLIADIEQALRP